MANHPIGPWARSNIKGSEGVGPMYQQGLSLPYVPSSSGNITGLNVSMTPFTAGQITFQIEKNGTVVKTVNLGPSDNPVVAFPQSIPFASGNKFRLLMSTSASYEPAVNGGAALAWLEAP